MSFVFGWCWPGVCGFCINQSVVITVTINWSFVPINIVTVILVAFASILLKKSDNEKKLKKNLADLLLDLKP